MKTRLFIIVIAVVAMLTAVCANTNGTQCYNQEIEETQRLDLGGFKAAHDSLYKYAKTLCDQLVYVSDGYSCPTDRKMAEYLLKTEYPRLEIMLATLDEIDDDSSLYDVYDDYENTIGKYYEAREKYEEYFRYN